MTVEVGLGLDMGGLQRFEATPGCGAGTITRTSTVGPTLALCLEET